MSRHLIFIVLSFSITCSSALAVENTEAEKQLREKPPSFEEKKAGKEKLYFSSYEEYSWVNQGSRKGKWKLFTGNFAYSLNDALLPYIGVNAWERLSVYDKTIDAGVYIKFKDNSYLRTEMGFGTGLKYLYRYQTTLEYEHRLVKGYSANLGFRFLDYPSDGDNVYIFSPGLRHYFGNHYISAFYNASKTEGRGIAQWGTLKGNFTVNDRLNVYLGTAVGQRLYDIFELDASKQFGYIGFSGIDFNVYKNFKLRLGGSYSMEKPAFRKRSLDLGGSVKF